MFRRRLRDTIVTIAAAALLLSACDKPEFEAKSDSPKMAVGAGTPVPAAFETPPVGQSTEDAADDPAIWVDPADRSRGVIIGTDKKSGIYVYDLTGKQLDYVPGGLPNNVDLREGFPTTAGKKVLVAASDRGRPGAGVALFLLDPTSLKLSFWAAIPVDLAEPYGLCAARRADAFLVIVNGTDGQVRQLRVAMRPDGKPKVQEERRFSVPTQPEGCVVDDGRGRLYLGEEGAGIWQFDMATTPAKGALIAKAPSEALKPDVEGLALLEDKAGAWLIASSQGDSAFAVWKVDGEQPQYRGRFSVAAAGGVDGVTGTDGVSALGGVVGGFPEGLVVMQDDVDEGPVGERQNFKLVDWREVRKALGF
ncbi:MAG: 3-phytase [Phenylobacterium zucineum]|nr:MAG: 3-phytase [Phenylobacterium zucineum]